MAAKKKTQRKQSKQPRAKKAARTAKQSRAKKAARSSKLHAPVLIAVNPRALYGWYARSKRDLPFRATADFYPIWVSEIMLQQTRVAAMLPRYAEFMRRFPTVEALANSSEEEVLAAWRGLGYYSRARNLRLGAGQVVAEHGGVFPDEPAAARKIKGVGEYTAAAILSIAYGRELAVFDGNVRRVVARLHHPDAGHDETTLKELALALLRKRGRATPGDHNQAMMELGALVCLPGVPACPVCPLRSECRGLAAVGGVEERARLAQVPPSKKDLRVVELEMRVYFLIEEPGELVWILKDEASRFFKNLWFFPVRYRVLSRTEPNTRKSASQPDEFPASPGLELIEARKTGLRRRPAAGVFQHGITHHTIRGRLEVLEIRDPRGTLWKRLAAEGSAQDSVWRKVPLDELHEVVVSSIAKKILNAREGLF